MDKKKETPAIELLPETLVIGGATYKLTRPGVSWNTLQFERALTLASGYYKQGRVAAGFSLSEAWGGYLAGLGDGLVSKVLALYYIGATEPIFMDASYETRVTAFSQAVPGADGFSVEVMQNALKSFFAFAQTFQGAILTSLDAMKA